MILAVSPALTLVLALALTLTLGHLEKLLVSNKSHVKHGKTHLLAKGLFSGLVGLGEKFEFFEVPFSLSLRLRLRLSFNFSPY